RRAAASVPKPRHGVPTNLRAAPMRWTMPDKDTIALRECMEIACRDPATKQQLTSMLENQSWHEVARFACSCVQSASLNLFPWQGPPCALSEDPEDENAVNQAGVKLLQRMLAAGVSRFDPDPLAALGRKKSRPVMA